METGHGDREQLGSGDGTDSQDNEENKDSEDSRDRRDRAASRLNDKDFTCELIVLVIHPNNFLNLNVI